MSGKQNRKTRRATGSVKKKATGLKAIDGGGGIDAPQFDQRIAENILRIKDIGIQLFNLEKQIKKASTQLEAMQQQRQEMNEQIARLDGEQSGMSVVVNEMRVNSKPAARPKAELKEEKAEDEPIADKKDPEGE